MKKTLLASLSIFLLTASLVAQQTQPDASKLLRSGPMLGYSEMTETVIWLQTRRPCRAQVRFWKRGQPASTRLSDLVSTTAEGDLIARIVLSQLEFGARYEYEVYLDGLRVALPFETAFQTQPMWRFRTDPPSFKFAIGSCAYINDPPYDRPGAPYGSGFDVFKTIAAQKPDLMIWLGDNLYFREADWLTETGMRYRYAHSRELAELQPLLASTHHYAAWDDHDYGPNDSDGSFRLKDAALEVFKDYWANNTYGTHQTPGAFGRFEWSDVEFFLLDDRYHRSPNRLPEGPGKVMFGERQVRWLMDSLASSRAAFKVIVSGNQVLNSSTRFETLSHFPEEQKRLFDFIRDAKVTGIIFLSGDRHHTELLKRTEPGLYPLYDFTSSPLTSGGSRINEEANNPLRVAGTWVTDGIKNFGLIEVTGPARDRRLTLRTLDLAGKEMWRHEIKASELAFPAAK